MTLEVQRPWTPKQQHAARLLAIGYTHAMAAAESGISLRQLDRLAVRADFSGYVQQLHEIAWERVEPGIMANVNLAIDVQRRMLIGEVSPSDKRYLAAERLIGRILDRLLYVEPATTAAGTSAVGSVNVLVGGGGQPAA